MECVYVSRGLVAVDRATAACTRYSACRGTSSGDIRDLLPMLDTHATSSGDDTNEEEHHEACKNLARTLVDVRVPPGPYC